MAILCNMLQLSQYHLSKAFSMNLTLPTDIEQALIEQANKMETTPEKLVMDSLRERFLSSSNLDSTEEGTLADYLNEFIGVLHSSEHVPQGANMSEQSTKKFADILHKKRKQGHL